MMRPLFTGRGCVCQTTLAALLAMAFTTAALAEKPRLLTPPEVWSGYNPDKSPLNEECPFSQNLGR